jgi:quercetin dioxygenase-like cupin family protein
MRSHTPPAGIAHRVDPTSLETLDVLGPRVQFLTPLEGGAEEPLVLGGKIPPGVVIPLHSHADPETFITLSGRIEALAEGDGRFDWTEIVPGEVFHVPGGAKHGFRNPGTQPAVQIVLTTQRLGRFFREVGTPVEPGAGPTRAPSAQELARFLDVARRYGYWNASPEENARVGIEVPQLGAGVSAGDY